MLSKLLMTAAVLAAFLGVDQARAEAAFPSKPVTVIIPFSAGGGVDVVTRVIGAKLADRWGQRVIVENKVGAGGLIGVGHAAKAPADGYTLLGTVNQSMVANKFLYKKLPYDIARGFDPILMMVRADQLIVANANLPVNSLKELVALARNKPGTLNYGSYGNGSQPHLLFSVLNEREGIDLTHVPYNGVTPSLTATAAGDVQLGIGSPGVMASYIQSGRVKPLALAGDERASQYPNVPTTSEQGFPYAKASIWYALFAPAGTPPSVLDKIRSDVQAVLADRQFVEQQITPKGLKVVAGDGRQLSEAIRAELEITGAMIKAAGIVAE